MKKRSIFFICFPSIFRLEFLLILHGGALFSSHLPKNESVSSYPKAGGWAKKSNSLSCETWKDKYAQKMQKHFENGEIFFLYLVEKIEKVTIYYAIHRAEGVSIR